MQYGCIFIYFYNPYVQDDFEDTSNFDPSFTNEHVSDPTRSRPGSLKQMLPHAATHGSTLNHLNMEHDLGLSDASVFEGFVFSPSHSSNQLVHELCNNA